MGRRGRQLVGLGAAILTLGTSGGLVSYVLTGSTEQQDHRAQVVGTVVATLLVVPSGIAWAWRWIAEHNQDRPDSTTHGSPASAITTGHGRTVELDGDWYAAWQSYKDGRELIAVQPVRIAQAGEHLQIQSLARGRSVEDGGYQWRGELRIWDNEILMGWYASVDSSVRSKGTFYFVLHPQGRRMSGRWVGLSYDGKTVTGLGALTRTEADARAVITAEVVAGTTD